MRGKSKAKQVIPNAPGRSTSSSPVEDHTTSPDADPTTSPHSTPSSNPINQENVFEEQEQQEPMNAHRLETAYRGPRRPPSKKYLLQPKGDKFYVDNQLGTNSLTNVFKSRLPQPYTSIGQMHENEVMSWFKDWKKYCTWNPEHEGHFYRAFHFNLGKRMSNIYPTICQSEKMPGWMQDDVYSALHVFWNSPKYLALCERNSRNRRSKQGSSVYTGGSISMHTRIAMIEEQTQKEVEPDTAFIAGYVRREDKGKGRLAGRSSTSDCFEV